MKNTIFTGAAVAIATPMHPDGSVNFPEFRKFIDFQIDNGTDAIVVCGTTGESATMDGQEHLAVIQACVEHVNGRVPVIAGTGNNDTKFAIGLSKEAESVGVDALLCVTPYYNKTSQNGLVAHYNAIADAVNLPIILYNVPSRTGVNIQPATYQKLAQHPNIVAAKEASGNLSQIALMRALCGDELDIYSGNDDQIVPILSLGGKGVISVLSNVAPRETHDICQKWFDGDIEGSAALQLQYLHLINALFSDVNPIPVKEALNQMGYAFGQPRLPLYPMTEDKVVALKARMAEVGLL